jgi:glutamate decarboxylase
MMNLTRTADYLAANLEALGMVLLSQKSGKGLPLVAFRLPDGKLYDEFALAHQLRERGWLSALRRPLTLVPTLTITGWVVPAYTMAPHSNKLKLMRIVVREDFSKSRCDALICDIKAAVENLDKLDAGKVKAHEESAQPTSSFRL